METINNSRVYTFKPSFLDKMTGVQLQAWIEAAEQVLQDNRIAYDKTVLNGLIAFQLTSENDYRAVCNLSMDIGMRALSLEAQHMSEFPTSLHGVKPAGHA